MIVNVRVGLLGRLSASEGEFFLLLDALGECVFFVLINFLFAASLTCFLSVASLASFATRRVFCVSVRLFAGGRRL